MTGALDFVKTSKGWEAGGKYGVNDEISAYRAQYSYSGGLSVPLIGAPPMPDIYGAIHANQYQVNGISEINASLINRIAEGNFGRNRTSARYPITAKGWNSN
jgi:hypothetical protein